MNKYEEILSKYVEPLWTILDECVPSVTKENALKAMQEVASPTHIPLNNTSGSMTVSQDTTYNMPSSESLKKAVEENSKHICPNTDRPCISPACGIRNSGVCLTLELMKHYPPKKEKPESYVEAAGQTVEQAAKEYADRLIKEPFGTSRYNAFIAGAEWASASSPSLREQPLREATEHLIEAIEKKYTGQPLINAINIARTALEEIPKPLQNYSI